MSIKGLLGFCECKGCWNRRDFDMDIVAHFENGKKVTKTVRICEQHAIEAVKGGTLKNVIFEDNIRLYWRNSAFMDKRKRDENRI